MATENQHNADVACENPTAGGDVELLDIPRMQQPGAVPGGSLDFLRYLPVLLKVMEAFAAGSGSFVTKSPWGRFEVSIKKVG